MIQPKRNQFVVHSNCSAARTSARRPGEAAPALRALGDKGFSLLEVMLAVVILGLGILGISAVFAGAAKQQQTSSEIQKSVAVGLNAKASLNRKLGSLIGLNPGDVPDRQWQWIRFFEQDIQGFQMSPTLDVRTIVNASNSNTQRPFFRVDAPAVDLYNLSTDPFTAVGQGTYNVSAGAEPFNTLPRLPHGLIIPETFALEVVVEDAIGGSGTTTPVVLTPVSAPPIEQDLNLDARYDYEDGSGARATMVFNPVGGGGAYIESFDLSPLLMSGPNLYIASIRALPYAWKNHKLLSLNERLLYVNDGRFPPAGQRPEGGFALFYRQLDEISEALVLTYSLLPQSRPRLNSDQFPLITPEFGDNIDSPNATSLVREADAEVRWDNARQQYYIRVRSDPDESWVAAPGQLLLMKHIASNSNGAGADNVVRVINQIVDDDDDFVRGYLDDVPRVQLTAVLPQRENQMVDVTFYALFPEIINADSSDDTRWKVRPVDARLIPIILR